MRPDKMSAGGPQVLGVLTVEAEIGVVPGPLRRLRELARDRVAESRLVDPAEILHILDEE